MRVAASVMLHAGDKGVSRNSRIVPQRKQPIGLGATGCAAAIQPDSLIWWGGPQIYPIEGEPPDRWRDAARPPCLPDRVRLSTLFGADTRLPRLALITSTRRHLQCPAFCLACGGFLHADQDADGVRV